MLDHSVVIGNPPDAPMLVPAIERVARRAKQVPIAVSADRGYGESAVGEALSELGVRDVVLPTTGQAECATKNRRERARVPRARTVADRKRGQDQLPETRFRLEPNAHRRARGDEDLVRSRRVQPQPGEDRRPGDRRMTRPPLRNRMTSQARLPDRLDAVEPESPNLAQDQFGFFRGK